MSAGFGDNKEKALRKTFKTNAGIKYPPNSFGILACDGLREHFSEEEIKAFLINHLREAKGEASPQSAARDLTIEAFRKGSTDNISTMVIDFNKLKELNPGKIVQLAIADGHGPKADKISHAACAALRPRHAPMQKIAENQEYPFDHKSQCLFLLMKLAVHKRHEKFKKEQLAGFLGKILSHYGLKKFRTSIPGTKELSLRPTASSPKLVRCFMLIVMRSGSKVRRRKDIENKNYKDAILKALHELRQQLSEPERLAKEWLKAYFKREKILVALDQKNDYFGSNDQETDYDTDSSQESDEEKNPRIDRDIELMPLLPIHYDSKLSTPIREDRSQSENIINTDAIPEFLNTCILRLPEILPGNKEFIPIVEEMKKAAAKKLTLRQKCEIIFKLIDKVYQLKIKSVNSSSLMAHSSLLSKVCNCLQEISVDNPVKFYRSLTDKNLTIQGLYLRNTKDQQAILDQETQYAVL